jgi:hypothetical protein
MIEKLHPRTKKLDTKSVLKTNGDWGYVTNSVSSAIAQKITSEALILLCYK